MSSYNIDGYLNCLDIGYASINATSIFSNTVVIDLYIMTLENGI